MTFVNIGFILNVTTLIIQIQNCNESWYCIECCSKILRDHNGNKAFQLFCAISVAIVFFIYLYLLCNVNFFLYFSLYDNKINLPKIFPFNFLSCDKNLLACCTNTDSSIMQWKELKSVQNSSSLKPTPNFNLIQNFQ